MSQRPLPPLQRQGKLQPEPDLTSATLSSSGSSQCSLHSQWLSRNVRTRAWAASAPRTRERIRPAGGSSKARQGRAERAPERKPRTACSTGAAPPRPRGSAALLLGRCLQTTQ